MTFGTLARRLLTVLLVFVVLRCSEALFATFAGTVSLHVLEVIRNGEPDGSLSWSEFRGAWFVNRTYYLSLGYLYFSALIFLIAELSVGIATKIKLVITNLGAYLLYTLAWMLMLPSGELGGWIIFVEVALVNWLMPILIWRFISSSERVALG